MTELTPARPGRHRPVVLMAVIAATALMAAACGGGSGSGVEVSGAWARTSPMNAQAGATYFVISADEATSIVSASVPADVAATVEIHETVMTDGAMGDAMEGEGDGDAMEAMEGEGDGDAMEAMEGEGDGDGHMGEMSMAMREVGSLDIDAGGSVTLEPGGLHIMLLDLASPLEVGTTFDLTLTTDAGDDIVVEVEVRDDAP